MKIDVWNSIDKEELDKIIRLIKELQYRLSDRGLKIDGLDVKVIVGDNELEEDIPLINEVIIYDNMLILDLRNVRLKDNGELLSDKLPAKTMAKYYINKAITLGDAYSNNLPSKLKHDTLELVSLIITNNIVKHLSLDNVDRTIVSSYIKALMILGLYDDSDINYLEDILNTTLNKSNLEIVDTKLLLLNAKEFGYDGFKRINNIFGGSARLSKLNKDVIKTIVMNLSNSILRTEIYKALDYPVLFIPLIIEHMNNLLYKRTVLFYNINNLKRFVPLDEFRAYNNRLNNALL